MSPQPEKPKGFLIAPVAASHFALLLCIAKLFAFERKPLPHHVRRQRQLAIAYAAVVVALSLACLVVPFGSKPAAAALGVMVPGAGFLQWAAGSQILLAVGWASAGFALFFAALILWFATGNLVAPIATWALLAAASARPALFALDSCVSACKFDPMMECARLGGHGDGEQLTGEPGFRRMEAHGPTPHPQHRVQAPGGPGLPGRRDASQPRPPA
jgi:hypothetical protein